MTYVIRKKRHVWTQPWTQPRVSQALQPGTSATIIDINVHGHIGVLTDFGNLWVPAGINGNLFYYNWIMDGELRERILRIIGGGSSTNSLTGVPSPEHFDPALTFHDRMQVIAYNDDTVTHQAEVLANGYTIYRYPDDD